MENPRKVMSSDTKKYFESNILSLLVNSDSKLIPTLKEIVVFICVEGGGYLNSWPQLMNVKINKFKIIL